MDGVTSNLPAALRSHLDNGVRNEATRPPAHDGHVADRPEPFFVESVSSRQAARHHIAWADLCTRALEPNVFLEPGFAVPLMQHVEPNDRPNILLVWERDGPTTFGRLLGLLPVTPARHTLLGIAQGYRDDQIALGTPLLDKHRAHGAFAAMIAWLHDNNRRTAALMMTAVPSDGPFEQLASAVCRDQNLEVRHLAKRHRALFRHHTGEYLAGSDALSAKRLKEQKRQSRRLSEVGARLYSSATAANEVAWALERFLALEHNGWKGRRGTSLLADGRRATFARAMTRLMAYEGKCRIDAIEIDGRPVAMGILLMTGTRAHFWKTAFDESLALHSPGVQFVREFTERLRVDPVLEETDSCALPGHAMIDRLWPERLTVVDMMIGVAPKGSRRFDRAERLEILRRRARQLLKDAFVRMCRR